jgi:hypothetical protein
MNNLLGAEAREFGASVPEKPPYDLVPLSGFDNFMYFSLTMGKLGAAVAGTDLRVLLAAIPYFK